MPPAGLCPGPDIGLDHFFSWQTPHFIIQTIQLLDISKEIHKQLTQTRNKNYPNEYCAFECRRIVIPSRLFVSTQQSEQLRFFRVRVSTCFRRKELLFSLVENESDLIQ